MSEMLAVTNPFDLSHVGELAFTDDAALEAMVARAHALHRAHRHGLPLHQRIAILTRAAALLADRADALARQIAAEGGKPLRDAQVEVARAVDSLGLCVKELLHPRVEHVELSSTAAGAAHTAQVWREPIGVVLAICAFNHPLNLAVHQVGPAVAVGAPVILKPSLDTPLSARALIDVLLEAGLPPGWAQLAILHNPQTQALLGDPRLAFVNFIGSAQVGWGLRAHMAPGLRYALEHGGAAPVLVDGSADRAHTVASLVRGGFYHAGQVCVSVQRVFAWDGIAAELAEAIAARAQTLQVGDPLSDPTDCGPLIRPAEVDRVEAWVAEAIAGGAQVLCGGHRLGPTSYAPTVLFNPPANARVSTHEVFGPVVCVYRAASLDDGLARANALPVPFQAAVFSQHHATVLAATRGLDAAAVMVNEHTAFRVDNMPFAGHGQAGFGVGGIGYTMHDLTRHKMIVTRHC